MIFDAYMQKVFGYLNVQNQSSRYITPKNLHLVLQAQAFRFPHVDLIQCIEETFGIIEEGDWASMRITFNTFYNCIVNGETPARNENMVARSPDRINETLNNSPEQRSDTQPTQPKSSPHPKPAADHQLQSISDDESCKENQNKTKSPILTI